jgi:Tfp pilus assembly protein PilN
VRTPLLVVTLAALLVATFRVHGVLAHRREATMEKVIQRGGQIAGDLQRNRQGLDILKKYSAERFSLMNILVEIANQAPDGVTLDTLTLSADGTMALTGRCRSYVEAQEFTRKMDDSELFGKASAPSLRRDPQQGIIFKMTLALSPKARKAGK